VIDVENLKSELPLPEGVLRTNIGIPIIVVVNKSDLVQQLERDKEP